MRYLQTNIGRGREAYEIALAVAKERNIDIVIISELNVNIAKNQKLLSNNIVDIAFLILNKSIGITSFEKGDGCIKLDFDNWFLYGCYISPNIPLTDFKIYIDSVMGNMKDSKGKKMFYLGLPLTDERSRYIDEWAAKLDLVMVNTDKTPTFERGTSSAYIDVIWATVGMIKILRDGRYSSWKYSPITTTYFFK